MRFVSSCLFIFTIMSSSSSNNNTKSNNTSSGSIPIHYTGTAGRFHPGQLNQEADPSEPLQSYDGQEDGDNNIFLAVAAEEDFHQRLTKHRSTGGSSSSNNHGGSSNPSSFWRTSSNVTTAENNESPSEPHFHSASLVNSTNSATPALRSSSAAASPSGLSAALQAHNERVSTRTKLSGNLYLFCTWSSLWRGELGIG